VELDFDPPPFQYIALSTKFDNTGSTTILGGVSASIQGGRTEDRMNSGHSTPSHSGLPHLSHAEPWAHHFICCDSEHQASTSTSRASTPLNRFPSRHQSHPSISTTHSFNTGTACCDETQCSAGDVVECCNDPGCSEGAVCEDEGCHDIHAPHAPQLLGGFDNSAQSIRELEEWACSKEGCHAIQQYVSSRSVSSTYSHIYLPRSSSFVFFRDYISSHHMIITSSPSPSRPSYRFHPRFTLFLPSFDPD
jgi:hypothetical protein